MKPSSPTLRPHQTAILIAGLASVLLWALPVVHQLMLPLQYLNTHVHEFFHAFAAVTTGGSVEEIVVHANGSGETPVRGGNLFLIASAGYLGAALAGAAIIFSSRTERGARVALGVLAFALLFADVSWVRGDGVGIVSGWAWMLALAVAAIRLKGNWLLFVAQFVGVQQCLNAVQSVYELLQISAHTEAHSDARILQSYVGVPAIVWALLWLVCSLVLVFTALRRSWSQAPRSSAPGE